MCGNLAELTQNGQPLGWLLTVLQKERASVEEITHALETALQHLETFQISRTQHHQVILYLASLVYPSTVSSRTTDLNTGR